MGYSHSNTLCKEPISSDEEYVEISTKLGISDDGGENEELGKIPTRGVRHPVI